MVPPTCRRHRGAHVHHLPVLLSTTALIMSRVRLDSDEKPPFKMRLMLCSIDDLIAKSCWCLVPLGKPVPAVIVIAHTDSTTKYIASAPDVFITACLRSPHVPTMAWNFLCMLCLSVQYPGSWTRLVHRRFHREFPLQTSCWHVQAWLTKLGVSLVAADELRHETFQPDRAQTGLPPGATREVMPIALHVTNARFFYIRLHRRCACLTCAQSELSRCTGCTLCGLNHEHHAVGCSIPFMIFIRHETATVHCSQSKHLV